MSKTVLVVEDDEMIAEVVRINLAAEGFEVLHAPNGAAGLASVEQVHPDLVLLDVMLPDIDGWTLLTRWREDAATRALPIVMLTAKSMPADQVRGYNLGANGYITKPFAAGDLVEKVLHVLHDTRGQSAKSDPTMM